MHPRTEELLRHLDTQHERLRAAVDSIPRPRRDVKPSPDRWSVAEVLEHLSIVETRIERVFSKRLAEARVAGLGPERASSPVVGTIDMDRLLDRTRRITATEAALPTGKLDADGLALSDVSHPHPVLGPINLYQWIAFVGGHEARHAAQVIELKELLEGPC